MLQRIFGEITYFFYSFNQNFYSMMPSERLGIFFSGISLIITVVAVLTALGIYHKQQRNTSLRRMIIIISSFDLLYYSLEKHYRLWKKEKGTSPSREAMYFWKIVSLTDLASTMQELKTLSSVYAKRLINIEINSLLEFLGDLILISYGGKDVSGKDYIQENIINSDDFEMQMESLIKKLSRSIGIKVHKNPGKDLIKDYIAGRFLK